MEQRPAEICDSFFVIKFISGTLNSWVHLLNIFWQTKTKFNDIDSGSSSMISMNVCWQIANMKYQNQVQWYRSVSSKISSSSSSSPCSWPRPVIDRYKSLKGCFCLALWMIDIKVPEIYLKFHDIFLPCPVNIVHWTINIKVLRFTSNFRIYFFLSANIWWRHLPSLFDTFRDSVTSLLKMKSNLIFAQFALTVS